MFEMMSEVYVCEVTPDLLTAPLLTVCDSPHGRGEIFELHTAIGMAAAMLPSVLQGHGMTG